MKFSEKIFSIKNENCHKILCFFGIRIKIKSKRLKKIFDLNKRLNSNEALLNSFLIYLSKSKGLQGSILHFIKSNLKNSSLWENLPLNVRENLLQVLFRNNQIQAAENLIKNFWNDDIFLSEIAKVPYLSYCLKSIGILNINIEKMGFVYEKLKNNLDNNLFYNYIENKTIAIVGNSGRELNTNNGSIIDSHDVVIRFGNYPKGYEKDYGKKTNVWVRGILDVENRDIEDFDFVLWNYNIDYRPIREEYIDVLYQNVKNASNKIIHLPIFWCSELHKNYGLKHSTSGAKVFYSILKFANTKSIDIYGFSFLDENSDDNSHYYDDKCRLNVDHNMELERKLMRKLYQAYCNKNTQYPLGGGGKTLP